MKVSLAAQHPLTKPPLAHGFNSMDAHSWFSLTTLIDLLT